MQGQLLFHFALYPVSIIQVQLKFKGDIYLRKYSIWQEVILLMWEFLFCKWQWITLTMPCSDLHGPQGCDSESVVRMIYKCA